MSRRTFWEVRLMSGYTCNPRYNTPSPDVLRKLELSRLEAENIETREMRALSDLRLPRADHTGDTDGYCFCKMPKM